MSLIEDRINRALDSELPRLRDLVASSDADYGEKKKAIEQIDRRLDPSSFKVQDADTTEMADEIMADFY